MHKLWIIATESDVAWYVCLPIGHIGETCKNGRTDRGTVSCVDWAGLREPCISWGRGSRREKNTLWDILGYTRECSLWIYSTRRCGLLLSVLWQLVATVIAIVVVAINNVVITVRVCDVFEKCSS